MKRELLAEFLGSAGLLIVVVGSGIMGENLSQGNHGIALLANSIATGAGLITLIQILAPISGAHFNPAVSFIDWLRKGLTSSQLIGYMAAQISGALVGVFLTHAMFGQSLLQISTKARGDFRFLLSEAIATFGLIFVISLSSRARHESTPWMVGLYITAAYWCTSSTSFANPAVTIARSLTDTFSGILWTGAPGFILAQLVGAFLAHLVSQRILKQPRLQGG